MKIRELAQMAGVSTATISRVLNNHPNVNEDTREKVLKLIEEKNYVPNFIAQSLSSKKNKFIAVIVPDINNPFYSEIIKNIFMIIKSNYHIIIFDTNDDPKEEAEILNTVKKLNFLGAIFCPTSSITSNENLNEFKKCKIPFVVFDRMLNTDFKYGVFLDDFTGGYLAGQSLIESGHKNAAVITGPLTSLVAINRLKGFKQAFLDNKLEFSDSNIYEGDFLYESGYENTTKILNFNNEVRAIFACNNLMTLGALKALKDFRMEEKFSLFGFDNPDYFDILNLNISGIERDVKLMAVTAINLLLNVITNPELESKIIYLKPSVKIKGSEKIKMS